MSIGGTLNGHGLNKAVLNSAPIHKENVYITESVAAILLTGSMESRVSDAVLGESLAEITITGAVNTKNRPALPDVFYPAFDRFRLSEGADVDHVPRDERAMLVRRERDLARVERDADTMRIGRDHNRMDVPQEESP